MKLQFKNIMMKNSSGVFNWLYGLEIYKTAKNDKTVFSRI